jgi:hypothetical protein
MNRENDFRGLMKIEQTFNDNQRENYYRGIRLFLKIYGAKDEEIEKLLNEYLEFRKDYTSP